MSEAKPTEGEWLLELAPDGGWCIFVEPTFDMGTHRTIASRGQWPHNIAESHVNAALLHDAGTVFNTTGLTPSQLVERVKELEEALRKISAIEDRMYGPDWEEIEEARGIADAALSKARPNTAEGE